MSKKNVVCSVALMMIALTTFSKPVLAAGMMRVNTNTNIDLAGTTKDEQDGKLIWEKLQTNKIACASITDDEYDVLGDYFMGLNLGSSESHAAMNARMTSMMGEEAEKQMHIFLGKRLSGCDVNTVAPKNSDVYLPMMGFGGMMGGSWSNNRTNTGGMMSWNNNSGFQNMATWLLSSLFLLLGIIYFWKGINKKTKK